MKALGRKGSRMFDKLDEAVAAARLTSAQAKEILYAAKGALSSLVLASPCRPWTGVPGSFSARCRRWALASAFSLVVHGFALLLLWGIRLPVTGAHSSSRATIFLSLVSPRVAQSNTPGNAISAVLPEEHRPMGNDSKRKKALQSKPGPRNKNLDRWD